MLSMAAISQAATVNFRVICIGCNEVSLVLKGSVIPLPRYSDLPYFMGPAEANVNDQ